ncbi:Hypothetical predicted protein [Paramuricea clavata]|uniref:Uncharacterized protein n=1 Tax=Paramuricea clavata TaxID=317549 RepID=A0A6S7HHX4_PARCT|nr:Hypothetical predicted protein [Paramuricea clavata]
MCTESDISENRGANYSLADLYNDGERLFEETVKEIEADPFNKIKGSRHGPQLVSIAELLLQNRTLCDAKKFRTILEKIWKAATSGDLRKFPSDQRDKMWQAFHNLCSSPEFIKEFNSYLCPALLQQPCCTLFIQTLLRKLFERIIHRKSSISPNSATEDISEETNIEENILRYAAGFVPFSLKRQCVKRQPKDVTWAEKIKCLSAIGVSNDVGSSPSFLEYTKCWVEKQNRGGLFLLNNNGYLFFRAVECHCKFFFRKSRIRTVSSDIRQPVLNAVSKDKVAMEYWTQATAGRDTSVSAQVMQMCIKLWLNIRARAFAANWIEQYKHIETKEAAKKKALRKGLKNIKNITS